MVCFVVNDDQKYRMVKFLKQGKVVLLTKGKYAGRKAVVVKTIEEPSKARPFPHAIVVGINRSPQPVTKSMSRRRVLARTRVQPFIKVVNYNHLMPTRYGNHFLDRFHHYLQFT
jgi:large subunit ribosomal protein L27e